MEIKILGGKNEIGGNKILLEHKDTKILLDFGLSFTKHKKYFSEFLQPRKSNILNDYFTLGILPKIKGIYRQDYLQHMGHNEKEQRAVDALFLSHAHLDHSKLIHFLREDIPIYMSETTKIILEYFEEISNDGYSEYLNINKSFQFRASKKDPTQICRIKKGEKDNEESTKKRNIKIVKPYETVQIGKLKIEMLPVDHSIPGSCGIIVYSDEGTLVYTGDIRFHGPSEDSKLSHQFIKKAKAVKPTWLLCEGTKIQKNSKNSNFMKTEKINNEKGVEKEISNIIQNNSDILIFIEHAINDISRINSIFNAATQNNRILVINLKLALLLFKLFFHLKSNSIKKFHNISLEKIRILAPKKSWGLLYNQISKKIQQKKYLERLRQPQNEKILEKQFEEIWQKQIDSDFAKWEKNILQSPIFKKVTFEEIKKTPSKYIISTSAWEIQQLIDINPPEAIWIKSLTEPFNDEMEIDEERKKNWLQHFNIKQIDNIHVSGHASQNEIKKLIQNINAKHLILIHTENPDFFKSKSK